MGSPPALGTTTPSILLIEDHEDQQFLYRRQLTRGGDFVLGIASTGAEALEMLAAQDWTVIVSDMGLPDVDGPSFLEQLNREYGHIPVVVLTASPRREDTIAALRAGACDFIVKPPRFDELRTAILRAIDRRSSREATNPANEHVLAIGAHPDDVEIGCGGTLLQHAARGDKITILTLSGGEAGGLVPTRDREAKLAAELLGARLIRLNFCDTQIPSAGPTVQAIEQVIRESRADVIYTHSANDRHQDHRAVHDATRIAARNAKRLLTYQSPSTTLDFRPHRFVDISTVMQAKQQLIAAYRSQTAKCRYLDPELIESTARYWGRYANYGLVEAFEVLRDINVINGRGEFEVTPDAVIMPPQLCAIS